MLDLSEGYAFIATLQLILPDAEITLLNSEITGETGSTGETGETGNLEPVP